MCDRNTVEEHCSGTGMQNTVLVLGSELPTIQSAASGLLRRNWAGTPVQRDRYSVPVQSEGTLYLAGYEEATRLRECRDSSAGSSAFPVASSELSGQLDVVLLCDLLADLPDLR